MGKGRRRQAAEPIETDPVKLGIRLLSYTIKYAAACGWRAEDRVIARGQGVEDIVQDAIVSLIPTDAPALTDKRQRWDPGETPDPMDYLRSYVNSRISTLRRSADARTLRNEIDAEVNVAADDPISEVVEIDIQPWRVRGRDLLLALIIDDELLVRTYDLLENEGLEKPSELAERLGVRVQDAKNALRRFWRAWTKVVEQLAAEVVEPQEVKNA
jgi:hypothetical protein